MKTISWVLMVLGTVYSYFFSTIAPLNAANLFFNGYDSWSREIADRARFQVYLTFGVNTTQDASNNWASRAVIHVTWGFFTVLFDIYWSTGFILLGMWGLAFVKI